MANLSDKDRKLAEKAVQQMYLPGDTQEWVDCLRDENIFKFRKLLKGQRKKLPSKYKRLYLAEDEKLEIALHHLRTVFPFFNDKEKERSWKFLELKDLEKRGIDPLNDKKH